MKEILDLIKAIWDNGEVVDVTSLRDSRETYWIILKQLEEIKEEDFTFESQVKEYADIAILVLRWMERRGLDPKKVIIDRLNSRHKGRVSQIAKKYNDMRKKEGR